MAFTALDPEEKGFIALEQVEVLAKNLGNLPSCFPFKMK